LKKLKFAFLAVLVLLLVFVGGSVIAFVWWFSSCQGRMRQCYASFRETTNGADRLTQARQRSIYGGFTASLSTVAFQVPLGDGTEGIVVVDRVGDRERLIATENYTHWSPRFSQDGKRLVFARRLMGGKDRELVSCETSTWHCSVVFRTQAALSSAAYAGNGDVLFSTTVQRAIGGSGFDVFVVRKGQAPVRLTNYEANELSPISVGGNKVVFGADGKTGFEPSPCTALDTFKCDKSDIYVLEFDASTETIPNKPAVLVPSFAVAGYSTSPIVSGDGKRVAFLNTNRKGSPWRYNIAVADIDGVVQGGFSVEGVAFSPGAFVGDTLLVNELFDDHYRVLSVDLSSGRVTGMGVKNSPAHLRSIEPITLIVDGGGASSP
jgi:dipeptidyl aminopeptidase/acylaminoacyl peptidase